MRIKLLGLMAGTAMLALICLAHSPPSQFLEKTISASTTYVSTTPVTPEYADARQPIGLEITSSLLVTPDAGSGISLAVVRSGPRQYLGANTFNNETMTPDYSALGVDSPRFKLNRLGPVLRL